MTKVADLRTGDILAWKRDRRNKMSNVFIKVIRFFTKGDFGHCGIVIRLFHWVFVLEASLPLVRLSLVRPQEEIWHIKMPREPEQSVIDKYVGLVGLSYGIRDALRAVFGKISKKDDEWQCAEVVLEYCRDMGYQIPECEYTPDAVVKMLCQHFGTEPVLVTD
jgi:hypothetical protein